MFCLLYGLIQSDKNTGKDDMWISERKTSIIAKFLNYSARCLLSVFVLFPTLISFNLYTSQRPFLFSKQQQWKWREIFELRINLLWIIIKMKLNLLKKLIISKGIPNGFSCNIAWSMHEGWRETFGKRKNTRAAGECIFTLSESQATSQVHGSRYILLGKPFGNCFIK